MEEQQIKFDIDEILSIPHRQSVATEIDKLMGELPYSFYEIFLGLCDFTSTILTLELSNVLETKQNKDESMERVNHIRDQICDILNQREARYLAEEMVSLISMLAESIIIGIKREKDIQENKDN